MKKFICTAVILLISFSLNCPHGEENNITMLPFSEPPIPCKTNGDCLKGSLNNCIMGVCVAKKCFYAYLTDGTLCDDQNPCTINEECFEGLCTRGLYIECPPPKQCYKTGHCDPLTGKCIYTKKLNGAPCNDNKKETLIDHCQNGRCIGLVDKKVNALYKKILSTK